MNNNSIEINWITTTNCHRWFMIIYIMTTRCLKLRFVCVLFIQTFSFILAMICPLALHHFVSIFFANFRIFPWKKCMEIATKESSIKRWFVRCGSVSRFLLSLIFFSSTFYSSENEFALPLLWGVLCTHKQFR